MLAASVGTFDTLLGVPFVGKGIYEKGNVNGMAVAQQLLVEVA